MLWGLVLFFLLSSVWSLEKKFINFGGFVCPREEKALGICLRDALNAFIPQIASGIPQFNVPPCEPLLIKSISIKQGAGPITLTSSFSDVTVRGPSTLKIKNVVVQPEKQRVIAKLHFAELKMKGHYSMKGQILMLPVEGDGEFTAKYGNIDATVTIKLGRRPRANSSDALSCEDLHVKFHIGQASMHLGSLFGGDNELGNAMNKFFNDNWEPISEELREPMEEALRDFLRPLADHTFGILDADDILLPDDTDKETSDKKH
ncbi:uncharacterized protein LOC126966070 [Leptidea sinapis]|uniref:uncharacterized protein LOC126966070 n=1 Tax=Leptidea sinapis TaxID=189913 RepID=UPI0021C38CF7|nr:uncharacterized protein LOC126966070 [Leptidea sinapis]